MTLAVMEGVAFALKDCVEVAKANGAKISSTRICGGGSKSPLWRQIIADVLNMPVETPKTQEGPAYGGAILAMVACGEYASVKDAADKLISITQTVTPDPEAAAGYEKRYAVFRQLYPALKNAFRLYQEL